MPDCVRKVSDGVDKVSRRCQMWQECVNWCQKSVILCQEDVMKVLGDVRIDPYGYFKVHFAMFMLRLTQANCGCFQCEVRNVLYEVLMCGVQCPVCNV